jgi:ATP-dependent helicase/nuclease subunit B
MANPCQLIAAPHEDVLEVALEQLAADLRQTPGLAVRILLPHAALITPFLARLGRLLPGRALPETTTLALWAAEQPIAGRVIPELERLSLIFDALKSQRWFEQQDRWALSRESLALVDLLTQWGFSVPADPEAFATQLAEAYAARNSAPLQFEARWIHELWWALNQNPHELSPVMAYQQQLASLASAPSLPQACYLIEPGRLAPAERQCLDRLSQRLSLLRIESPLGGNGKHPAAALVRAALCDPAVLPLAQRAQTLRENPSCNPAAFHILIEGCAGIESEAERGAEQVQRWLGSGRGNLAIVALDRLVARRLRAMLERKNIAVRDESGWTFSTTAASTVVMRWLEMVARNGYHRTLQDLLRSPFLCADWAEEQRRQAILGIERAVLKYNWVSGLDTLVHWLEKGSDHLPETRMATELAHRLKAAAKMFPSGSRRFQAWMECLRESLDILGISQGLAADAAGLQLKDILDRIVQDTAHASGRLTFPEWVRALDQQFESASFLEPEIAGAVCMTQLSMTRLRTFDAVLVVGGDAEHLPYLPSSAFLGDAVRASLGLPTREDAIADVHRDLLELLSRSGEVFVTWRKEINGEANPLAASLQRLDMMHQLAWGRSLVAPVAASSPPFPVSRAGRMPAPVLKPEQVPQKISASSYNRLLACPYQFFAATVLRLAAEEGVQEKVDKRDYGEIIHAILLRFHRMADSVTTLGSDASRAKLLALTEEEFSKLEVPDEELRAWRLRWEWQIPGYVEWALSWEREGWRWQAGEKRGERLLGPKLPGQVLLYGTLDRVDVRRGPDGAEQVAILDYKLKRAESLKRVDVDQGEDVQLAVYAILAGSGVVDAAYLALEGEMPERVACSDPRGLAEAVGQRLVKIMQDLREGVPLPAHGDDESCQWCDFGGLCRRDHWEMAS